MKNLRWFLFAFLAIAVGFYPMVYFVFDPKFGLLSSKSSELLASRMYNFGFYTHIVFGGIALLTGWSQFSKKLRRQNLNLHRTLGKIYVASVFLSSLAGICIAFHATGGWFSAAGFLSLGLFWFFATTKSYLAIRQKQIAEHEKWMIFSFAACFAAVTLRIWLPFLIFLHHGEFVPAYRIVAWLCWIPNLVFAWFLTTKKNLPA